MKVSKSYNRKPEWIKECVETAYKMTLMANDKSKLKPKVKKALFTLATNHLKNYANVETTELQKSEEMIAWQFCIERMLGDR